MRAIVDDLALLYELSLATGTSLDLEANCDAFLQVLLARKNLDYAAVWLDARRLDRDGDGYHLVYANPASRAPEPVLAPDHPLLRTLGSAPAVTARCDDGAFAALVTEAGVTDGHIAVLRLGDLGVLKLYARSHPDPFPQRTLAQLGSVLAKFAVSIDGCLAHARLRRAIDERQRAEEALRLRDRAMAATTSGMVIVDMQAPDEPIIYANPAFTHLTGYPLDEVVGYNCRFLQGPETDPDRVAEIRRALSEERECRVELRNYRRDGTPFWNELVISPVWDDAGRLTHYVGIQQDLTERVRAEEDLRRAKLAAEASGRAKEQFLANMSHEMRTPLNAVSGLTHLLQRTDPTPEQKEYLDAIQFSADALLTLVNDLLDLAKIGAGKVTFEAEAFRPHDLLRRLTDTFGYRAREKGLDLRLIVDDRVPAVLVGDASRIGQILLNLLSNAVKFTETGGVTLVADRSPGAAPPARGGTPTFPLRLRVRDTGIGIPPDMRTSIFETFTQARADTSRKYGGTGLGLAIVKELAERQGGRVGVESCEGEGSTFTVVLPLPVGDAAALIPPAGGDADDASVDGARVLLVEDNELNQLVAVRLLESWGAVVTVADHGQAALDRLAEHDAAPFDAVLMDVQMPEMDGFETTRRIRRRLGLSRLPIIALTASVLADRRDAIRAAGMDDFIFKPFDPDDLRRCLARHVRPGAAPAAPPPPARDAAIDLSFLESSAMDRADFVVRMLDLFLDQAPMLGSALAEGRAAGEWPRVRFAAHKLKGSASFLGARTLQSILARVETAVDADDLEALPDLLDDARAALDAAIDAARRARARYAEASEREGAGTP